MENEMLVPLERPNFDIQFSAEANASKVKQEIIGFAKKANELKTQLETLLSKLHQLTGEANKEFTAWSKANAKAYGEREFEGKDTQGPPYPKFTPDFSTQASWDLRHSVAPPLEELTKGIDKVVRWVNQKF